MSINGTTWTAMACDIGKRRHNNEDYVLACEPANETLRANKGCLYIVADGIGGGAAGEVASLFVARAVAHHYYSLSGDPAGVMGQAISKANSALYDCAHMHPRLSTMGTTIVAAAIEGTTLRVAHAGDSRAYLVRQGILQRLTQDHNLAAQLARDGAITAAQAARHPQRHLLLRSIGNERQVLLDRVDIPLLSGDILLLCSDGLTCHISDSEIADAVVAHDPTDAVMNLVRSANHRGGQDNISVLVTLWDAGRNVPEPHQDILTEPPPLPKLDVLCVLAQAHTSLPFAAPGPSG